MLFFVALELENLCNGFRGLQMLYVLLLMSTSFFSLANSQCTRSDLLRPSHCYKESDEGESYHGTVDRTVSGKRCAIWSDVASLFSRLILPSNRFCRNYHKPMSKTKAPWCFHDSLFGSWEYCRIPSCEELCDTKPIDPNKGSWSPFTNWSKCSKSCGKGGTKSRTRVCLKADGDEDKGKSCKGEKKEVKKCNDIDCDKATFNPNGRTVYGRITSKPVVYASRPGLAWWGYLLITISILLLVSCLVFLCLYYYKMDRKHTAEATEIEGAKYLEIERERQAAENAERERLQRISSFGTDDSGSYRSGSTETPSERDVRIRAENLNHRHYKAAADIKK